MIPEELSHKFLLLYENEKWKIGEIASHFGVHHATVARSVNRCETAPVKRYRRKKLDPFVPFILKILEEYPNLKAPRLFQMLVERGYTGKLGHFRNELRRIRPKKKYEPFLRIDTLPGEQAQVDWGYFGKIKSANTTRRLYMFIMVLSWSRQIYIEFFLSMEMYSFLQGHVNAFEFFSGVPREVLHDNLKSAVSGRYGDLVKFNKRYLEFAAHYKFLPKPCNIRRGNEKGKCERGVRYVRDNFFAGRPFSSIEDLNAQALKWCLSISQERPCRSSAGLSVGEAFEQEKSKLLQLPADPYPTHTLACAKVGKTNYARFDTNDYSVPGDYVRTNLIVKASHDKVSFYYNDKEIASHTRSWGHKEQISKKEHYDEILERKKRAMSSQTTQAFLQLIPEAKDFINRVSECGGNMGATAKALHRCLNQYGEEFLRLGIIEGLKANIASIPALCIQIEKLQAKQGCNIPLQLSREVEEKTSHVSTIIPNLSQYDSLGGFDDDE